MREKRCKKFWMAWWNDSLRLHPGLPTAHLAFHTNTQGLYNGSNEPFAVPILPPRHPLFS